ncbi:DUF6351 family protein [Plantactinospora sp. B6F1]|uniref:DUF6351 family protein n=1 Tax=Plantactinospora sp. B6F1 TaxID=3158971 RepID=UPI0032D8FC27
MFPHATFTRRRGRPVVALALVGALLCGWPASPASAQKESARPAGPLRIESLSTPAGMVSGGDVLIRVAAPGRSALDRVRVTHNGLDVTDLFRADQGRRELVGLVTGLAPGHNLIAASTRTTHRGQARLTVTNHPITGPVVSGPHQQPYVCATTRFALVDGTSLGPALDADCSAATRVDYAYRSTAGTIKPLPDPTVVPADLARTTTTTGVEVPFLIRIETGTINRAIYQISMLHDPARPEPTLWQRSEGWNGRLIYTFGGGCRAGWYVQGAGTGGVLDPEMLGRGYAVASSSLNVFGNNCNDLVAAESTMMVKEHFIERYGPPRFTIGWGASGGAYQGHQIADNYPGLLDGIIVGQSFPDVTSATNFTLLDARLLDRYFDERAPGRYTDEQRRRISGFAVANSIPNLSEGAARLDPAAEFSSTVPQALRYHPVDNPGGARGDVYDHTVNVYGRDPATGFARRPLDNVGVQYGLAALNAGVITTADFLDLNANIGGLDIDANHTPARTVADLAATRAAYRTGRILSGGAGLASTAIIDYRAYSDAAPNGDIHMLVHGFATRARLVAANGDADNHVMLMEDSRYSGFSLYSPVLRSALTSMDTWLTRVTSDRSGRSPRHKVRSHKPVGLGDACWTPESPQRRIDQTLSADNRGECGRLFPAFSTPRLVAGAPLADDVVKCQLKAIDVSDYGVAFTPAQRDQLREIFPDGVCDWSVAGVEQQPLAGPWLALH